MANLYEKDAYLRQFSSKVVSCTPGKAGNFEIELAETAFYPGGGGQPCDKGWLSWGEEKTQLVELRQEGESILHILPHSLEIGQEVSGTLDWQWRFDLMQQHSGEHIVSGMAHKLFGCENVGFHMGEECITIDLDKLLSAQELAQLEEAVNDYIWQNHPVTIQYPNETQLAALEYRSKKALEGAVRIVSFTQGGDCCACCGTHVARAGDVGFVKLLSCQKFRQGVRMELLCGRRALVYLSQIREENKEISTLLSAKVMETSKAVARLGKEKESITQGRLALEKLLIAQTVSQYQGECPLLLQKEFSLDALRAIASQLAETTTECVPCFLPKEDSYCYVIAWKQGDVRPFVKRLQEIGAGGGGGTEHLVQGSIKASWEEIQGLFLLKSATDTQG